MNATELFLKDGRPSGVFYCDQCRVTHTTEASANRCCAPTLCQYCGKESGREYWTVCDMCEKANSIRKEQERFERAKKLTEWDGWVFIEGVGNEGFSESIGDFWDNWELDHDEADDKPEYVWACKPSHFVNADISNITERIFDNAYDGFDEDDLNGLDELKLAIEKFNEANKDVKSYEPDYTTAVLLNRPEEKQP